MSGPGPRSRTLAFAGVLQAVRLVQAVARDGEIADEGAWRASIESTLCLDPDSIDAVYGAVAGVRLGLSVLADQLAGAASRRDAELMRYTAGVIHLERRLVRDDDRIEALRSGVDHAAALAEAQGSTHEDVVAQLAEVYARSVSTLGPRILVHGRPEHLSDELNASRVRALLLAAIRSAVLWRQAGGGRIGLVLGRARYVESARALIVQADAEAGLA